jgi:hypothetical protein
VIDSLVNILKDPAVWYVLIGYWVFSALVGALPTPLENGSLFYQFIFRFTHGLSGNLSRAAIALKVPGAIDGTDEKKS